MRRCWRNWVRGLLLILALPVLGGCLAAPASDRLTIREGALLRLGDGWEVGLQLVYRGRYTDATGQVREALLARLSVWDGQALQAATLVVHEGAVFDAGGRYRVVKIRAGRPAWLPGTAGGSMAILPLP